MRTREGYPSISTHLQGGYVRPESASHHPSLTLLSPSEAPLMRSLKRHHNELLGAFGCAFKIGGRFYSVQMQKMSV